MAGSRERLTLVESRAPNEEDGGRHPPSGFDSGRQSYFGSSLKPPYGFTRVRSRGGTKNPMPMDKDPTGNGLRAPLGSKTQHHSVTCR